MPEREHKWLIRPLRGCVEAIKRAAGMIGNRIKTAFAQHGTSRLAVACGVFHAVFLTAVVFSEPALPSPATEPCVTNSATEICFDVWDLHGLYLAGRFFHQDPAINLLMLADLPILFLAGLPAEMLLSKMEISRIAESYVSAIVLLVLGTLQWWMIGVWISAKKAKRRPTSH